MSALSQVKSPTTTPGHMEVILRLIRGASHECKAAEDRALLKKVVTTLWSASSLSSVEVFRCLVNSLPSQMRRVVQTMKQERMWGARQWVVISLKGDVREGQQGIITKVTPGSGVHVKFSNGEIEGFKFKSVRLSLPTLAPPPPPPPPPPPHRAASSLKRKREIGCDPIPGNTLDCNVESFKAGVEHGAKIARQQRQEVFPTIRNKIMGLLSNNVDSELEKHVKMQILLDAFE